MQKYVIVNEWDEPIAIAASESDAQELIFSLAEERAYEHFCKSDLSAKEYLNQRIDPPPGITNHYAYQLWYHNTFHYTAVPELPSFPRNFFIPYQRN